MVRISAVQSCSSYTDWFIDSRRINDLADGVVDKKAARPWEKHQVVVETDLGRLLVSWLMSVGDGGLAARGLTGFFCAGCSSRA